LCASLEDMFQPVKFVFETGALVKSEENLKENFERVNANLDF